MKVKLLSAAFILSGYLCMAQSSSCSLKWGLESKGSRRGSISQTIGFDDTGYYIRAFEKSDQLLKKLDTKLNEVASVQIEEKDEATKMRLTLEGVFFFNKSLLLFQSSQDRDSKKNVLYVRKVNKKTMEPQGKFIKLAEIDYESRKNDGSYTITSSKEDSKLMIVFNKPYAKNETEKYGVIVCDTALQVIWKKDFELPYIDKLFVVGQWKCDDDGDVYMMGKAYKGKAKDIVRGEQNFTTHLIAYTNNGEKKMEYEFKLPDKFITDITFALADNGDIVSSGFYSNSGQTSVDGAFYLTMDPLTKNIKSTSVKEFDIDFITQGMSERAEKKARRKDEKGKDLDLYQYDLHDLVLRDDGGVVLIGEQYYVQVITTNTGKSTYTTYVYHYDNLIVINITPQGKIEWAQKILKKQISKNDGGFYSSFALAVAKDKMYFVFNDARANLNIQNGKVNNFNLGDRKGIVTLVTVQNDGTIKREALYNNEEVDVLMRPKVCEQINDDQMLLFGEKGKAEQFGIVTFK